MSHSHAISSGTGHDASHEHPPFLAHHFDNPQQQFASGKLGMWVFLATELLMFGGLFCAYAVYRANHPDVFIYAHEYLDKFWGGLNTVVLIASSLTMAWAVRTAQLGKKGPTLLLLALTFLGGVIFMGVKAIEYHHKWEDHLWVGFQNKYNPKFAAEGVVTPEQELAERAAAVTPVPTVRQGPAFVDPNAGTPDEVKNIPPFTLPASSVRKEASATGHHSVHLDDLPAAERKRINSFFGIYFTMTGLHGFHVLVGMALIAWIFLRTARGEFSPAYYTPVDLVGLYWHLVDLIWIFLFPLLYLIH
jgi:cytochrome c oxidase subunit 3